MILVIWVILVLIFLVIFAYARQYYSHKNKKAVLADDILEQHVKYADEYEIAFLKGGDDFAKKLAFYRLLKSGFIKNLDGIFTRDESKDKSQLEDFEKAVFMLDISSKYGEFIFADNNTLLKELLGKYKAKASKFYLFYERGSAFMVLKYLFIISLVLLSGIYIIQDSPLNPLFRLILIISLDIFVYRLIKNYFLDQPASILIKTDLGHSRRVFLSSHILTPNGKKYISLFEKMFFPVDGAFQEAWSMCPCSV